MSTRCASSGRPPPKSAHPGDATPRRGAGRASGPMPARCGRGSRPAAAVQRAREHDSAVGQPGQGRPVTGRRCRPTHSGGQQRARGRPAPTRTGSSSRRPRPSERERGHDHQVERRQRAAPSAASAVACPAPLVPEGGVGGHAGSPPGPDPRRSRSTNASDGVTRSAWSNGWTTVAVHARAGSRSTRSPGRTGERRRGAGEDLVGMGNRRSRRQAARTRVAASTEAPSRWRGRGAPVEHADHDGHAPGRRGASRPGRSARRPTAARASAAAAGASAAAADADLLGVQPAPSPAGHGGQPPGLGPTLRQGTPCGYERARQRRPSPAPTSRRGRTTWPRASAASLLGRTRRSRGRRLQPGVEAAGARSAGPSAASSRTRRAGCASSSGRHRSRCAPAHRGTRRCPSARRDRGRAHAHRCRPSRRPPRSRRPRGSGSSQSAAPARGSSTSRGASAGGSPDGRARRRGGRRSGPRCSRRHLLDGAAERRQRRLDRGARRGRAVHRRQLAVEVVGRRARAEADRRAVAPCRRPGGTRPGGWRGPGTRAARRPRTGRAFRRGPPRRSTQAADEGDHVMGVGPVGLATTRTPSRPRARVAAPHRRDVPAMQPPGDGARLAGASAERQPRWSRRRRGRGPRRRTRPVSTVASTPPGRVRTLSRVCRRPAP